MCLPRILYSSITEKKRLHHRRYRRRHRRCFFPVLRPYLSEAGHKGAGGYIYIYIYIYNTNSNLTTRAHART